MTDQPTHRATSGKIAAQDIDPLPARRRPMLIAILVLSLAFMLLGLGMIGFTAHFGHKIDERSRNRDAQHSQTEQEIRRLQSQLAANEHKLDVTVRTEHDSLCGVAETLFKRDPTDQLVLGFARANGCKLS